ncbi:MAG: hypothetical protein R3A44_39915 [Caldilineaceae bacterium]
MTTVTMPLPRMNNIASPATVTFNLREMPFLDGPGIGAVAADGAVETDTGEWSLWQNLEGAFISTPAAAAWGDQQIDLFGISTDSQLYHKHWDGANWTFWESLEGTCIYAPAAVARGANLVDVFVIGLDKQVYRKTWNGAEWQGWEELGGTCIHGLAATAWGPDRIDLFTVGTNSCLYHNSWDGAEWQGWEPLRLQGQTAWEKSSTTIAAPAAVASAPGRIDLFVLGIDNQIYQAWGDGENWQGWINLGGPGMHGLAVTARGPQALDLFTIGTDIEGTDNHMYHRAMAGASWGAWDNLGGACISAPAAVALGQGRLDAFVVGTRSALFQKTWQGESSGVGVQDFTQPEKDAAKVQLNNIRSRHFTSADEYRLRAKTLIDTPAMLNQGSYGVCGMATAVYFLLQYDLDKYIDLIRSIFDGNAFNGIPVAMKVLDGRATDYTVLLYGRERQLQNKLRRGNYDPAMDFDFIVSRSLGKLLKIKNPDLYQSLTRFCEQFDPLFNYHSNIDRIELFHIDFNSARELEQTTALLNSQTLSEDLKQKIMANEIHATARLGNGIDLRYPNIKVTAANEWDLEYGWPAPGAKFMLDLELSGSKLKVSSDRNPIFQNGEIDFGGNIKSMTDRLDREQFVGGDRVLFDLFKQFNFNALYDNALGIDLGPVLVHRVRPGQTWQLECNGADKKVLTITRTGNTLTFFVDLSRTYHSLTNEGDLAFDLDGLVYLMREVVGVSEVDFTYSLFRSSVAKINETFQRKSKPFVLATVNGYTEWSMAKWFPGSRTFDAPPVPEARIWGEERRQFAHIVAVTGPITEAGAYYQVPVWTWATEFTLKIRKELLPQYIHGYVYGDL